MCVMSAIWPITTDFALEPIVGFRGEAGFARPRLRI
jgi:hypothetical protein